MPWTVVSRKQQSTGKLVPLTDHIVCMNLFRLIVSFQFRKQMRLRVLCGAEKFNIDGTKKFQLCKMLVSFTWQLVMDTNLLDIA